MRIGFFADMYLPYISGVTNHMRLYKRYFEACGHEVFLCTFGNTDYTDDEANVIRTPALAWGKTGWNLGGVWNKQTRALIPTLDIAHVHHPFQSGRLLVPHLKRHHIPLVFSNHSRYDLSADHYARLIPLATRRAIIDYILRDFLAQCSLIIAPSNYTADWLQSITEKSRIRVVPNGIETAHCFSDLQAKGGECVQDLQSASGFNHPAPRKRSDFGLEHEDFVLCTVGRIAPEKNFLYLLEEFLSAAQQNAHLRLLVIGDGPDMKAAKEIADAHPHKSSVVFAGQLPYEDLPDIESLCDGFITASVVEAFGLAVVEALAVGLPIIAIKAAGIAENVYHEGNGLLADAPAPGALAAQMLTLASNAELREKLACGARKDAECFSLKNTAGALLAAYEELL